MLVLIGLLLEAVNLALKDRRFELPSTSATVARSIAEELILWQKDPGHAHVFNQFAAYLSAKLKLCFVTTHKSKHLKQAKMWGEYHKLRTSASFKAEWENFLDKATKQQPSVAFYQFVTHELFKELIKMEFTVDTEKDKTLAPLTHEEKNALRYVAGYVCRKVHNQLKQSSCPGREVMMLCLSDMNGDDIDEDDHTDEWLRKINRGGLWKITDEVYQLFYIMEEQMKQRLSSGDSLADGKRTEIIEDLLENEDLLFQWCFCTSDLPNEFHITLLKLIIELFMTVHGHAYASSCLELYKERNKETLSKKKALRTVLNINTE